jgi:AcrR family transcriptional regulator
MPKLKPETLVARKAHILKAAMVCFSKKGYHQTTMDDIVQVAGLSKGGLYVHFSSKKELFLALLDWFVEEFRLFTIPDSADSTAYDRLMCLLADMVAVATSDIFFEISSLMTDVWAQNSHDQEINQIVKELYEKVRLPLSQLIEEGITEGTFKLVDATALANMLIAMFEGLMIQAMIDEMAVDWNAVSRTLPLLVNGILIGDYSVT